MTASRKRTRQTVIGAVVGLVGVAALGGWVLALAEGTRYLDGVTLAFSTISTAGFGTGPTTGWGLIATMIVFAAGASCWFAIVVVAFETGLRRTGTPVAVNGSSDIDGELWRRVAQRPGGER